MHQKQILFLMNKLLAVIPLWAAITILSLVLPQEGLAHTSPAVAEAYVAPIPSYSARDVEERLHNLSSVLDLRYTTEVGKRVKEYTVTYRAAGERILGKINLYFPLFEAELAKRNLPQALKYVAVVESHLDPHAKSKSGAAGLWQFMPPTAKRQGLDITKYIDERQNPQKSTEAALDYLSEMYDKFGDWTLAVAAYNCGPGGVRKAIRRSGKSDYWSIRNYLPKETQKYIPRIVAAIYLMQYYHEHNLVPQGISNEVKYSTVVTDGKRHRFSTLARDLDMELKDLKILNAQFITDHFPKNDGHLELVIPKNKEERYLELYDPALYKAQLEQKNEIALQATKEKMVKSRLLQQLHPIDRLVFDRIRHKRVKKIYFRQLS